MLASPPCFFIDLSGITPPVLLSMAAFLRLPTGGCLQKGRAHSHRYVIIQELFLSCGTEEAPRLPGAGTCNMPLLAASPAAHASVWPSAVRHYVAKAKAAEAPVHLLFLRTVQETHPILMWAPLSSFSTLAPSRSTYALRFPL